MAISGMLGGTYLFCFWPILKGVQWIYPQFRLKYGTNVAPLFLGSWVIPIDMMEWNKHGTTGHMSKWDVMGYNWWFPENRSTPQSSIANDGIFPINHPFLCTPMTSWKPPNLTKSYVWLVVSRHPSEK